MTLALQSRAHIAAIDEADVDLNFAPRSLRQLAQTIGIEAALKLTERLGGTYVIVPKHLKPVDGALSKTAQALIEHIGAVAAAQLVMHYGGEQIELCKADSLLRQIRDKRIARMLADPSYTQQDIAMAADLSIRQVRRLQERLQETRLPQMITGDLFP
jgi:CRP-like cAMP-binding protein